jgi:ubiquinone/menaquinone biosynthesis C-methylase UbiE/uncharacterized protein YbaR (Trm112 family)
LLTKETVGLLRCPTCGKNTLDPEVFQYGPEGEIGLGVFWCRSCRSWFPIEDGLLELLSGPLSYAEDRSRFWKSHEARLKQVGLAPPEPAVAPAAAAEESEVARQQQHFDWYAENPTQTYEDYEATPFWRAADALAFDDWRSRVRPRTRLLDVGCAQGRSTFRWMDLDCEIVGFDISKALIRQAIDRYRRAKPRAKATFFVADATRFPLRSAAFDYVTGYGVLHHFPDPKETCREIVRTLKPGGVFFSSENNETIFRKLFDLLQKIHPVWHEEAGAHALISERELRDWLEPTGCQLSFRTSVFVPPHLANLLGHAGARLLLRATDALGSGFPPTRRQGGLILARAEKP